MNAMPTGPTTEGPAVPVVVTGLGTVNALAHSTPAFVTALREHELLESFVADIELGDGSQHRLIGFYTINEERLQALPGAALEALQRAGHLEAIYMAIASLSNFRDLIARRERRMGGHAA